MPTKNLLEIKSDLAILGGVLQGLDAAARTEAILHLRETVELLRLGHEAQEEARSPPKKIKLDETGAEPSASGDEWLINTDTFLNDDSTISEDSSINDVQIKEEIENGSAIGRNGGDVTAKLYNNLTPTCDFCGTKFPTVGSLRECYMKCSNFREQENARTLPEASGDFVKPEPAEMYKLPPTCDFCGTKFPNVGSLHACYTKCRGLREQENAMQPEASDAVKDEQDEMTLEDNNDGTRTDGTEVLDCVQRTDWASVQNYMRQIDLVPVNSIPISESQPKKEHEEALVEESVLNNDAKLSQETDKQESNSSATADEKFKCPKCEQVFSSRQSIENHNKNSSHCEKIMKIRERLRLRQLASSNSEVPDVNQGHGSIKTENENPAANINKHQSYSEQELNVSLKDGLNLTEEERKSAWEEYDQEKKGVIQTNIGIENAQQFGEMLQNMLPRSGDIQAIQARAANDPSAKFSQSRRRLLVGIFPVIAKTLMVRSQLCSRRSCGR